jgi:putative transposase
VCQQVGDGVRPVERAAQRRLLEHVRLGGKALRRAMRDVFGEHALVHRCHRPKKRNVCDLLPGRDRDQVRARIRSAWSLTVPVLARQRLELLAAELDRTWPDAAGSLREGIDDTLTLTRLGITASSPPRCARPTRARA